MGGVRDTSGRKETKTKMNPLGLPPDAVVINEGPVWGETGPVARPNDL